MWHLRKRMGKTPACHVSTAWSQGRDMFYWNFLSQDLCRDTTSPVSASSEIPYQLAKQALWVLSSVVGTDNWKWQVRQSTTDYQSSGRCWSHWQSKEVCTGSAGLCQIAFHKCHRVQALSHEGGRCSFLQHCRPKCALVVVSKSSHKSFSLSADFWESCRTGLEDRLLCVSCSAGEGTRPCSDGWQQCKSA